MYTTLRTPWLNRAGSPVVKGSWRWDAASSAVVVSLEQSADYRLPLEIAIGDRVDKIELKQRRQTFTLAAGKEPDEVRLDPGTKVLINAASLQRAATAGAR